MIGTNLISARHKLHQPAGDCMALPLEQPWLLAFHWLTKDVENVNIQCSQVHAVSPLQSSNRLVIPGYTKMIIPGNVKGEFMRNKVVGNSEYLDRPLPGCLILTPSISRVTSDTCTVLVQLENVSSKAITIPPDVPLCLLQEVQVIDRTSQDEQLNVRDFLNMFDLSPQPADMSAEDIERLNRLLHKLEEVFSVGEWDLRRTDLITHHINMQDDHPIKQRHRCIPHAMYNEVRQYLKEMLNAGLISESFSPWASPLVLVRKKDGSLRLCIDFGLVNKKTIRDSYYLPRIDESMNALAGAHFVSVLDLKLGFWPVELAEEHKE